VYKELKQGGTRPHPRRQMIRTFAAALLALLANALPADGEGLSRHEALELQKECGMQAAKAFKQAGWKVGEPTNGSTASFESHYNLGMNKCFMLLRILTVSPATGTKSIASTVLLDAYEQREYAELNITDLGWMGDPVGHRHIATCALMPPDDSQRTCRSEAEYASFVERYMETTVNPQDTVTNH
jgi:hypothetical protein